MIIEKALLARVLFSDEWKAVLDRRVTPFLFQDVACRNCFMFVSDFYSQYSKVPSIDLIEQEFPELKLKYAKEPAEYYLDRMTENYIRTEGSKVLLKNAKGLVTKPTDGLAQLQSDIASLSLDATPTKDDAIADTIDERKARYIRLKNVGGMDGFGTPWEVLNEATMGLHAGDFIAIVSRPGVGKEQSLDSTLYGPNGPFRMGDAKVGMKVLGKDGKPHTITGVFPQGERMVYRVTFTDKTSIETGKEHLWTVRDRRKKDFVTMTLGELMEKGLKDGDHRKWVMPMTDPAKFEKRELPLDPYVLGCLLADGCVTNGISFHNSEPDVIRKFESKLPVGSKLGKVQQGKDYKVSGLANYVKKIGIHGLYSYQKFIPVDYKYSDIEDRLALLQGLFDCDGTMNRKGTSKYNTSSEQLAKDVQELVESLGGTATIATRTPKYMYKGEKKEGRTDHRIMIRMPSSLKCYSSEKHGAKDIKEGRLEPYRNIVSIEEVGLEETQCIMVDAEDSLYLTDHFVPTHNTFVLTLFAEHAYRNNLKVLFVTNEMSNTQIMQRFDAVHFKLPYKELRAGLLPDHLEKIYFDGMDNMKHTIDMIVTQDVQGVNSIASKIDQYKPDLLLIDGMYLLADEQKNVSKWEGISNISRNLKKLARKKQVPVIATTQFNRTADEIRLDKVTLSNLGFSDSIGQDADVVLGLFRTKDMEMNQEMRVRMLKVREGEPKDFTLNWDLRNMEFNVVSTEDDDEYLLEDEESISY